MNITPFTFHCGGCLIKADRERKAIRKKGKEKERYDGNSENSNCRNIGIQ